jgi:diamine N-acetyltransferase
MRHNYIINTSRLRLRQLESNDLEIIRGWRNHESIRKWFFSSGSISSGQQISWYKSYLDKEADIMFIAEEVMDINEPIGTVALYKVDMLKRDAEFGRLVIGNLKARGRGIGRECLEAVCGFGFKELGLEKIYLEVFKDNTEAVKLYEKAGFKPVNTYAHHDGRAVLYMEMTKELQA